MMPLAAILEMTSMPPRSSAFQAQPTPSGSHIA